MAALRKNGKKLLLIMNVPPPYQGTTIMNKYLLDILQEESIGHFHFKVESSKDLSEIGKFSTQKFKSALYLLYKIFSNRKEYSHAYLIMSVNGIAFYRHASFILLLQLLGKQCILNLHGLGFAHKKGFAAWITRTIFKRSIIIQHSPYNKFDIEKYPCRKVYYLPNGIADEYGTYKTQIESHRQQQSSTINIVFLSNLFSDKGVFVALEAARIIEERAGNDKLKLRWSFIGKWHNENTRQQFTVFAEQHNLTQYIDHTGPLYNEYKFLRMVNMDILIFPTFYKHETWGNVILEAMMFKIPVIASEYVAIPEMVQPDVNGYLISKQDAQALADKIMLLAGDWELRTKLGEQARETYLTKFTLTSYKQNVLAILNDILQ